MQTQSPFFRFLIAALFTVAFLFTPPIQAQDFPHAGAYMDHLGSENAEFSQDLWQYIKASSHGKNARKVENKRMDLIKTIASIVNRVKGTKPYEGDATLRDAYTTYFTLNYNVLREEYSKIVDMEAIAEESYDLMEAYLTTKEEASKKVREAGQALREAEKVFAETHNIELIEGEQSQTSQNLKLADEVISYYNDIYLIFFKSYKQEAYLLDALNSGDVNAMLQNKNALGKTAKEGQDLLAEMAPYKDDVSVIVAAKEMLSFFEEEAGDKGKILLA